jgi:hypothetical protein
MSVAGGGRFRRWAFLLRPHRVSSVWWFGVAAVLAFLDYLAGPHVQFTATFVVPVFLAAWYSSLASALILAVILPVFHLALMLFVWDGPWDAWHVIQSAAVRTAVYAFQAFVVARLSSHERELEREVDILEGLLPICMHCKSIRNEIGEWEPLERYIATRSEATFTHGLCRDCNEKHYPELAEGTARSKPARRTAS